jgi:FkbM family methyltransferase
MSSLRGVARGLYRAIPFKQPVFEAARRLVRVPEPVYRHLHFRGVIDVPVEGRSFRMVHHGTQIENEVFWSGLYGRWEGASLRMWVRAAQGATEILDVGTNTGLYALAAKAVAPHARVAALEPVERIRTKLVANVALNRFDITVIAAAASDRDGTATLLDPGDSHALSATLDPAGRVLGAHRAEPVTVTVARIDSLIAQGAVRAPDLLKIDVEGHEPAVLRGMERHLRERRPVLFIEVLTAEAAAEVNALVKPLGYLVHRLDAEGPHRLSEIAPAPGTNLLLTTQADWDRLRAAPAAERQT